MSENGLKPVERERAELGHRASPAGIMWILGVLLVAYPLSIGPAARLHNSYRPARPAIEAMYAPVVFLSDHSEPARGFLQWYVEKVWMVR